MGAYCTTSLPELVNKFIVPYLTVSIRCEGKDVIMSLRHLELGTALALLLRTTPILLVRLGLYAAFWLLTLVYFGLVGGFSLLLSQLWPPAAIIILVVALIGLLPLYRLANRYLFYVVKAAQLAVVVEMLEHGELPNGASQIRFGMNRVMDRFGAVSAMFVVDGLVRGVLRGLTKVVSTMMWWLPGRPRGFLRDVFTRLAKYAVSYVDEAILARTFWRKDEGVWEAAREGIVLYGMVWRPLLVNALALTALSFVPFLLAVVLFAAPIGILLTSMSPVLGGLSALSVLLFAILVKIAIGDSYAMIAMVAAYYRATRDLHADAEIESRISAASRQFRIIQRRALGEEVQPSRESDLANQSRE